MTLSGAVPHAWFQSWFGFAARLHASVGDERHAPEARSAGPERRLRRTDRPARVEVDAPVGAELFAEAHDIVACGRRDFRPAERVAPEIAHRAIEQLVADKAVSSPLDMPDGNADNDRTQSRADKKKDGESHGCSLTS